MAIAKNTRTVIDETLAPVLTRSQRLRLSAVAKATGLSAENMTRRGLDLFLDIEAPVYLAHAKQAQSQRV
jgi:hypothetical protein